MSVRAEFEPKIEKFTTFYLSALEATRKNLKCQAERSRSHNGKENA